MSLPEKILGDVRINAWQKAPGHKVFRQGDKMWAHVPGRKNYAQVTFQAHVIPLKGVPHLEIIDHKSLKRSIQPEAVK